MPFCVPVSHIAWLLVTHSVASPSAKVGTSLPEPLVSVMVSMSLTSVLAVAALVSTRTISLFKQALRIGALCRAAMLLVFARACTYSAMYLLCAKAICSDSVWPGYLVPAPQSPWFLSVSSDTLFFPG